MNSIDPRQIVLEFNECINRQDIDGLSALMSEDHTFIDRDDGEHKGKEFMTEGWIGFFKAFPDYRNTFERVETQGDLVVVLGFAIWDKEGEPDRVIWTAKIENDLVAEWRIYVDTEENRKRFNLV